MKFLRRLRSDMRLLAKSLPQMLVVYVGIPVMMLIFMSMSMSSLFQSTPEIDAIRIAIDDQSDEKGLLQGILEKPPFDDYLKLDDHAKYTIVVPKGWLSPEKDAPAIRIDAESDASRMNGGVVKQIVGGIQAQLRQQGYDQVLARRAGLDESQKKEYEAELAARLSIPAVERETHKGAEAMSAGEYYAVAMFSMVLIYNLSLNSVARNKEDLEGLRKREGVSPSSALFDIVENLTVGWITGIAMAAVYLIIARLYVPTAFEGIAPLSFVAIAGAQVLAYTAIGQMIGTLLPYSSGQVVLAVISLLIVIFGGMLPIARMAPGSELIAEITRMSGYLTVTPYFDAMAGGTVWIPALGSLVIGAAAFAGTVGITAARKEL